MSFFYPGAINPSQRKAIARILSMESALTTASNNVIIVFILPLNVSLEVSKLNCEDHKNV